MYGLRVLLLCLVAAVAIAASLDENTESPYAHNAGAKLNDSKIAPPVSFGAFTPNEFQQFASSIALIRDAKCRRDLNATLWGVVSGADWAIAMYDATVRSAAGIAHGVLHQFGHFDECLKQRKSNDGTALEAPVLAKYCLTDVTLDGLTVQNIVTRHKKPSNRTVAHWGACVPASCNASDVAIYLENFLQRQVTVNDQMCQLQENELHINEGMFVYAFVILFFICLAALSTAYHAYLLCTDKVSKKSLRNETLTMALLSFSIIENLKKMFQASKDQLGLNSINGIKALAMLLILGGHAIVFILGGPMYNAEYMMEQAKRPTFAFLTNSLLFVDTFLLLSGFLFCRILLIELERRRGKINVVVLYVARYIRLTPAYMAIIGFYMTWFPSVGSGPLWQQRITREQERCNASWWLNILYINNYVNTDKLCMFQSWYLSVDSQLFFLAPIAIFFLYKTRKFGLQFLSLLVAITAAVPFVVTYLRELDPTFMAYPDEVADLSRNEFYSGSYIKTHMRASAYVIGLLAGYLVHLMQEKSVKLPSLLVRLTWCFSAIFGTACMYTICRFYDRPFTNLESVMYAGFHKLGWNLSVAWLVLAVTTGHAGWLQKVLSSRVFAPISRLTYCAYLSNGIVELYHSANNRHANYIDFTNLLNDILSHILNTFTLALVLCLLFESPIHALERILLRKVGRSEKSRKTENNSTPSTSEEQVA